MAPFLPWEDLDPSREIILAKYKAFKRRRKGTEDERVLTLVEELLADREVTGNVRHEAHKAGREAGFVEAAGIMGVLLDSGERPADMESAKVAMVEVSERIAEFLPLRWKPISELPAEGVFIGWRDACGCDFFWVGHHSGERRCYSLDALISGASYLRVHPTHFMPTPKAPGGAWDADLETPELSGMTWLVEALEPFSQMAGLLKRFHEKTKIDEVQLTPMLNLFVADFERAEQALEKLKGIVEAP
ncbi:hypothetical protein D3C71_338980 [compost metagenome]